MSAQLALALQPQPAVALARPLLRLVVTPVAVTLPQAYDDGIAELVAALREDYGLGPLEALCHAADMLDELDAYCAGWDSMAFVAGNCTAMQW